MRGDSMTFTQDGYVTEGTVDNIFIHCNDILMTPPLSAGILEGVARNSVIHSASQLSRQFCVKQKHKEGNEYE
ncbi:MAG: aminotransferase class IV [Desulfosporosinus sp.]|nr:aminotransferase class IV [Desulfosporosinus sp.]MBC2729004.1 aminotransferase class IV [Desulfosporosinus sp.]